MVKSTGFHHRVIKRYYDGTVIRYDKDVLARLCFVLDCKPSDLIRYEKPIN